MVPLTHVSVTLPTDKVPTKRIIRDIVGVYFPQEWRWVDPETLQLSYHAEFTNAHCIVARSILDSKNTTEPLKVFIKFLSESGTAIDIFWDLLPSKEQETILCHDYSLSGRGAKVYGFFRTEDGTMGRIDEFLDARNLEPTDVEDAAIRAEVAVAMAIFHTLETAVPKKPVSAYYNAIIPGLRKYHGMETLKALGREGGVSIERLVDYDFAGRIQVATDAMDAQESKAGWCIHDVQFMNTMVKNNGQPGESTVSLIDFEFVMRNYRGFDIGGHFMQKLFKWFNEDSKIANCREYTEEEKRDFCDHYVKEWNRMTGNSDTPEQVFLESEYGYMLAIAFDVHNMLWYMNKCSDKDPLNLQGLNKLFDEFRQQYRKLDLPEPPR